MDIKPEYELFGREIDFDDITPIVKVYQPGILDESKLFNPTALSKALDDLCFFSKEDILVYFNNISGSISCRYDNKKGNWWDPLQKFSYILGGKYPTNLEMEYWYGPDGKEYSSPVFKEDKPPYQAFIRLFDNAIQAFSCFVDGNKAGIRLSSERNNYHTIKEGEGFVHDNFTLWKGKQDSFLAAATILHNALYEMKHDYNTSILGNNFSNPEIRIISPKRGALVGRLVGNNSATILVNNSSLEKIAQKCMEKRLILPALISR